MDPSSLQQISGKEEKENANLWETRSLLACCVFFARLSENGISHSPAASILLSYLYRSLLLLLLFLFLFIRFRLLEAIEKMRKTTLTDVKYVASLLRKIRDILLALFILSVATEPKRFFSLSLLDGDILPTR